jgi:hypothetical protein
MNQLRAYDIQQQMWLREQQVAQLQRENAAKQAAIQQWGHLVPADKLPQIATMILQNAPYDQIARAAAEASGQLIDKTDPASTAANIKFMEQVTGKPWTDPYPPYAGEATGAYIRDLQAKQAGAVSGQQEGGKIAATRTANEPLIKSYIDQDTPEAIAHNVQVYQQLHNGDLPPDGLTPAVTPVMRAVHDAELAIRTANNQQATDTGKQNAINTLTAQYRDSTNPGDDAFNRRIYSALNNGAQFEPGLPVPVGDKTRDAYNRALGGRQETEAEAKARGAVLGGGMDASKPTVFPTNLPQTNANIPQAQQPQAQQPQAQQPQAQQPQTQAQQPVPVTQTAVPPGATPDPNRPGWYWQGGQLRAPINTGGSVIGTLPGDADQAKNASDAAATDLTGAFSAGEAATKLKNTTAQIRVLEEITKSGGLYGQLTAGLGREMLDKVGLGSVTTPQQAQDAEDQLIKTEIPSLIKSMNMRAAKPELDAIGTMTGTADVPPAVLNNILANLDAGVDYTLSRKDLAGRSLGFGGSAQPMNYPEFQQEDTKLLSNYNTHAEKLRQGYGAVGTNQPAPTTPDKQPLTTGGGVQAPSMWDAVSHLFGGGSQTPAEPSVELDPNTGLPKGQAPPSSSQSAPAPPSLPTVPITPPKQGSVLPEMSGVPASIWEAVAHLFGGGQAPEQAQMPARPASPTPPPPLVVGQ